MITVKDLIKTGLLSENCSYRRNFETTVNNKIKRGYFEIELSTSRTASLFAKFYGSEFPCRQCRVLLSTSLESIIFNLQQL